MRFLLPFLILLFPLLLRAQDPDSLKKAAYTGPDSSRVDALTQLAKYYSADDASLAMFYANEAYAGAEKLDDERRKAWALNYMGSVYYYQGQYDSSYYFHKQALDIRLTIDDPRGLGASYNNIGLIYDDQGKTKEALDYYLKAVAQFEKAHFVLGMIAVNSSLGSLYFYQEDFPSAEKYFSEALKLATENGDQRGIMNNSNNMALVLEARGDTAGAIVYLEQGLKIANDQGFVAMMITGLNNLGQIYVSANKPELAMPVLRRAVAICDSVEEVSRKISPVLNIAYCYFKTGVLDSAQHYAETGLDMAKQAGWKSSRMEAFKMLSEIHYAKEDFHKAYDYRLQYESVKDSVFNDEKTSALTEMQTKYDTDQVLKDNQLKDVQIAQQEREKWFYISGALLLAILAVYIFLSLRKTRRLNRLLNEQKGEILEKNADLSRKNDLIEEQKHEITSSIEYASRIQSAMLPSPREIHALFPGAFVFYRPRDIVSGDFYFVAGDASKAVFAVADCTGHGVPGAMMSMIAMEKLREAVALYDDPGSMLAHLNKAIKSSFTRAGEEQINDGLDIALCVFDRRSGRMTTAAANRPVLIVKGGVLVEYKPTKSAIGGITPVEQEFRNELVLLEPGDIVYLFSDGFADQFGGPEGKKFMSRRFRDLLQGLSGQPLPDQLVGLEQAFTGWKGGLDQIDDVLVVGIRF